MYNERKSRTLCLERIAGEPQLRLHAIATLGAKYVEVFKFTRTPTYDLEALIRDYDASDKNTSCEAVVINVEGFMEP